MKAMTAGQVRALTSPWNRKQGSDKLFRFHGYAPANRAAVLALVKGLESQQWRVALGCCEVLGKAQHALPEATRGLVRSLSHVESSVRNAAAKGLGKLSEVTTVPCGPIWTALQGEDNALATLEMAKTLSLVVGPSEGFVTEPLLKILAGLYDSKSSLLPLVSTSRPLRVGPKKPGVLQSLFGARCQDGPRYEAAPSPFWELDGEDYQDYYGIVEHLLVCLARAPGEWEPRRDMISRFLQLPILHFNTCAQTVVALAEVVEEAERPWILEQIPRWGGRPDYSNRLAWYLARQKVEWTSEIVETLLDCETSWDWSNWPERLAASPGSVLEPLVGRFERAGDEERLLLLKLLKKCEPRVLMSAFPSCLLSSERKVVLAVLSQLEGHGQPVPELLESLLQARQTWAEDSELAQSLDAVIGQSSQPSSEPPPSGRLPDQFWEWTLKTSYRCPYSGEQQSWEKSFRATAFFTGQEVLVQTSDQLAFFDLAKTQGTPRLLEFGSETLNNDRLSILRATSSGDLLLGLGFGDRIRLGVLARGESRLPPFSSHLPEDEVAKSEPLRERGDELGWEMVAWKMSHFESDPGHDKPVAYLLNRKTGKLRTAKQGALSDLPDISGPLLNTGWAADRPTFRFLARGGYRGCWDGRMVLPPGPGNPLLTKAAANDSHLLALEVFPNRAVRVYLWSL